MRAIGHLAMVDAEPLQYIGIPSVNFSQVFVGVALRQKATLLAKYRGALFLDNE